MPTQEEQNAQKILEGYMDKHLYIMPNKSNKFRKPKRMIINEVEAIQTGYRLRCSITKGECFTLGGLTFMELLSSSQIIDLTTRYKNSLPPT